MRLQGIVDADFGADLSLWTFSDDLESNWGCGVDEGDPCSILTPLAYYFFMVEINLFVAKIAQRLIFGGADWLPLSRQFLDTYLYKLECTIVVCKLT
jgi:hypothetical protein